MRTLCIDNAEVRVVESAQEVARAGAEIFEQLAGQSARDGGVFRVALSGGSTPRALYALLAGEEYRGRIAWERVRFFFGDERWVPHDHPDSNYRLARVGLFEPLGIDEGQVFPMPTEGVSPDEAARQYEESLRREFRLRAGEVPRFDLLLQGMGEDGHTASLFPHTGVVLERHRLVAAPFVEKLGSHRITLTPPVLQASAEVVFMLAGEGKAAALREVLEGEENVEEYPSQIMRRAEGRVTWVVDEGAAGGLGGS